MRTFPASTRPFILLAALMTALVAKPTEATPPYPIDVTYDLIYGVGVIDSGLNTKDLLLDLYEPVGAIGKLPAVVIIHGGGFTFGDKGNGNLADIAEAFAADGWIAASINYRLSWEGPVAPPTYMPFGDFKDKTRHAAVVETRRAVRWLRSQTWLPVDEDAIFALGTSAGGFVANEALIAPQTDFTTDLPGQTIDPANHPGVPHDIAAAVDLWGKTLTDNVDGNDPPVLIIHGTADTVVDFSYSQDLADAAAFAGMSHDFVPLPGEDHGPFDVLIDGLTIAEYSMDFLADSIPVPEPRQDLALLLGVVVVAQLRRVRQSRASARR